REDMTAARDIVADSAFPSYQPSAQAPLASGKVRFVGEPVAMAFAPTRAEAEDIAEQVLAEFDELPALTDVAQARQLAGAERVRVISPDVGDAFGYNCVLQQEELCIAWLAMTYKRPFRFIEDRREHLTAGANSREHHYELTAYADARGRLLALDAKIAIDGG